MQQTRTSGNRNSARHTSCFYFPSFLSLITKCSRHVYSSSHKSRALILRIMLWILYFFSGKRGMNLLSFLCSRFLNIQQQFVFAILPNFVNILNFFRTLKFFCMRGKCIHSKVNQHFHCCILSFQVCFPTLPCLLQNLHLSFLFFLKAHERVYVCISCFMYLYFPNLEKLKSNCEREKFASLQFPMIRMINHTMVRLL